MRIDINSIWNMAGRELGWKNTLGWAGIGISSYAFNSPDQKIEIHLKQTGRTWKTNKNDLLDFINKNNSVKYIGKTKLGVVPIKLLDELDPIDKQVKLI